MTGWDLLLRIVGLLAVAAVAGLVLRRLGQNVIVGYLLAGLLLGPTGVGLVRSGEDVRILSELGVALLLFSIGLEFSFVRLRRLGSVAMTGGTIQMVLTAACVFAAGTLLGVPRPAAMALALAFAMSSTAVVFRELTDRAQLESAHGRNAVGILLLQDVAVIPVLILTDALARKVETEALLIEIALRGVLVSGFVVAAWAIARYLLPRVFAGAALSGSRDLPVVIAVCTSIGAAWAAHSLGFSPSLGAFAAGIVLAESPFSTQIRADVTPLSAVFVTLFFASVGTAVQLPLNAAYIGTILLLAAAVMIGKTLVTTFGVWFVQRSLRNAFATGLIVSQVGEFTFVVSDTAFRIGILSEDLFQTAMAISLITLMATPLLIGAAPKLSVRLLRRLPHKTRTAMEGELKRDQWKRVIVIGFGPAGRAVVNGLTARQIPLTILEMNPNTVAQNRIFFPIELGDASQTEVLQHVGVGASFAVVVTVPDPNASRLIVESVHRLAPGVPVLVRLRYHQYYQEIQQAGAERVIDEEEIVGLHLAGETIEIVSAIQAAKA